LCSVCHSVHAATSHLVVVVLIYVPCMPLRLFYYQTASRSLHSLAPQPAPTSLPNACSLATIPCARNPHFPGHRSRTPRRPSRRTSFRPLCPTPSLEVARLLRHYTYRPIARSLPRQYPLPPSCLPAFPFPSIRVQNISSTGPLPRPFSPRPARRVHPARLLGCELPPSP